MPLQITRQHDVSIDDGKQHSARPDQTLRQLRTDRAGPHDCNALLLISCRSSGARVSVIGQHKYVSALRVTFIEKMESGQAFVISKEDDGRARFQSQRKLETALHHQTRWSSY